MLRNITTKRMQRRLPRPRRPAQRLAIERPRWPANLCQVHVTTESS